MAEYKGVGVGPWRGVVDACVRDLHDSDLMIVLLFRRAGNPIEVDLLGPSPVSVLEIELFHAALGKVPVLFFQAEDFRPEPGLRSLIGMLRRLTKAGQWVEAPEADIERHVIATIEFIHKQGRLPPGVSGFCDSLSDRRSFVRIRREVNSTRLSLLAGFRSGRPSALSFDRVDLLLTEAEGLGRTGSGTYADRLSRLWMALRELAQRPVGRFDHALAGRWIRLCELWASSAAWLRLHGPLELGVLATLHTRVALRNAGYIDEASFPYGPFASEAYSIAKVSERLVWKARRFEAARLLATRQISLRPADPSGAYGIRASASMQLARLRRPWLAAAGLLDYRRMLATRQRIGSPSSEVGEAMAELGFAEFAVGRHLAWARNAALRRLREGVALLDSDHPERRPGFVVRAKLKLAESLELAGHAEEAAEQRRDIVALKQSHGLP